MNIKQAKKQIIQSINCYLAKDEFDNYLMPIQKQRPIYLLGACGIGKTAIMYQIAKELNINLLAYSMTHHTRQSALGLPMIVNKQYEDQNYNVSHYTMSEIIASIYEIMTTSNIKEGILFLDEINCVSETLMPSMLQFLQYKSFANHHLPKGWVIVCAGNPTAYNSYAKDFDIVVMDRLKRIDIEPNYQVFKEYSQSVSMHPAIITYLENKKENYYKVENTIDGKMFVTPRSYEDLSDMMRSYEKKGYTIDIDLISQYLQHFSIAKDFSIYYDLFIKYQQHLAIEDILNNNLTTDIIESSKASKFDERIVCMSLLCDNLNQKMKDILNEKEMLAKIIDDIKQYKNDNDLNNELNNLINKLKQAKKQTNDHDQLNILSLLINFYTNNLNNSYEIIKKNIVNMVNDNRHKADMISKQLDNAFSFIKNIYQNDNQLLIFITNLTINKHSANFIAYYGNDIYYQYSKNLMFDHRHKEIEEELAKLAL